MVLKKQILILEDDLLVLSKLLERLDRLEDREPYSFHHVILADYVQVEDFVNSNPKAEFDLILLDRDCKLGGSFHTLDIERFGVDKVVSMSSVPEANEAAKNRGVKRSVLKDFQHLDEFADKVIAEVEGMVRKTTLSQGF
jgi:hypothetical protein